MDRPDKFSRRQFIQMTALAAGSVWLLPACTGSDLQWRFFTEDEGKVVDAIADRIIPPDEWPGGKESGVTNYIDKQLVGPLVRFKEKYRKGIAAIQNSSQSIYSSRFEELSIDRQLSFLETMEAGKMNGKEWAGRFDQEFFEMIRDHSMQAYYGSPRHGGNRNNMSYKMLKLDYPLVIGQNRYKS